MRHATNLIWVMITLAFFSGRSAADVILYTDSPSSYPLVTGSLNQEYGTASFPPLLETAQSYYQVNGNGSVPLTCRFTADTGLFQFDFGFYRLTPAINAIDTSTDAGKISYAIAALSPSNATLVFNDQFDNPGAIQVLTTTGGDTLGFFLIPDNRLSEFQQNPSSFSLLGNGGSGRRWPLFGFANANPGGFDQLMSFFGSSTVSGQESNLFGWEDLTRALSSDNSFNDCVLAVEGVIPVPEPSSVFLVAIVSAVVLARKCSRRGQPKLPVSVFRAKSSTL